MKPTDVRVKDVTTSYEDYVYRTPIKFGGVAPDPEADTAPYWQSSVTSASAFRISRNS